MQEVLHSLWGALAALHKYAVLNYLAVIKIVKKHDKAASCSSSRLASLREQAGP